VGQQLPSVGLLGRGLPTGYLVKGGAEGITPPPVLGRAIVLAGRTRRATGGRWIEDRPDRFAGRYLSSVLVASPPDRGHECAPV